jgi:short-subunit dehydrogenase
VLSDPANIVKEAEEKLGPIDILINNAGISHMARFATDSADLSKWWKVVEVNLLAPISMIRAITPCFSARGKGTIITVGSSAADLPLPFLSSYCASKAGVQKAVQIIDMELREKGILNFVIQPGAVRTTISESVEGDDLKGLMDGFKEYMIDTEELAGHSMVALAARSLQGEEGGVGWLSGRFWDCEEDLEELIAKREEIEEKGLYQLRIQKL